MTDWEVKNGQLRLMWSNADDIINFINTVVKPSADMLGVEITITKKDVKKKKTVQP